MKKKLTDEQKMLKRIERYWNGEGRSFYLDGDHFPIKVFKYGHSTPNWTFDTYEEFKAFWDKGEHEYGGWKHFPNEFHVYVDYIEEMLPKYGKEEDVVRFFNQLSPSISFNGFDINTIMDADLKGEKCFIMVPNGGLSFKRKPHSFHLESNLTAKAMDAIIGWQERHDNFKKQYEEYKAFCDDWIFVQRKGRLGLPSFDYWRNSIKRVWDTTNN